MSLSQEFPGGITNGAKWYPIHGGMQDWNYIYNGYFELTLEISDDKWPHVNEIPVLWEYNKKSMLNLIASIVKVTFAVLRTKLHKDTTTDGGLLMGALFFTLVMIMFSGLSELFLTIMKLHVFYKQRDLLFFPAWAYALPTWILKIPITLTETAIWDGLTYYVIGFDSNVGRFFKLYLLLVCISQMASGLFRLMGSLGRNMIIANTFGSFALLIVLIMGGFILSHDNIKKWWIWGYWISPMMYGQNAIALKSWNKVTSGSTTPLRILVLRSRGMFSEPKWYWIGVGALVGYIFLFNLFYTLALTYLKPIEKTQPIPSDKSLAERNASKTGEPVELSSRISNPTDM